MCTVRTRRIYEPRAPVDGVRVLVDRLWPRGMSKEQAAVDTWMKAVAPSTGLRRWFAHDPSRFDEFARRYRRELEDNPALEELAALARRGPVTLLYAAADTEHNHALVLSDVVRDLAAGRGSPEPVT